MTTTPRSPAAIFISTLLASAVLLSGNLLAVPPAAPSNVSMQFTRIGYDVRTDSDRIIPLTDGDLEADGKPGKGRHGYHLKWTDNAIDEDGYTVSMRFGNGGPYYPLASLDPNSIETILYTGVVPDGTDTQFQIQVWKFNGSAVETSTRHFNSKVPLPDGKSNFAPPTNLTVSSPDLDPGVSVSLDDGSVQLTWEDKSAAELFYEIEYRELPLPVTNPDDTWQELLFRPTFNTTSVNLSDIYLLKGSTDLNPKRLLLVPGNYYQFRVRTTQGLKKNPAYPDTVGAPQFIYKQVSNYIASPIAADGSAAAPAFQFPALRPPSNLNATTAGESQILLTWTDNSKHETGYQVQYREIQTISDPPYQTLGTVGANITSVNVPVTQGGTAEFRVRAVYHYTPTGSSTATDIFSDFTATTPQANTSTFAPPTQLTATTSGMSGTVDLTWQDNSVTESGFDILTRVAGSADAFRFARAVRAGITRVSVNSFATTVDPATGRPIIPPDPPVTDPITPNSPIMTPLTLDTPYEFIVRAVGNDEGTVSISSNTASSTPKAGFTMPRLYHPIKVGDAFSYQLSTTTGSTRSSWEVTGLPAGLSFNDGTGLITGTPTVSGIFQCPLKATFANGTVANVTLSLRVLRDEATPLIATPLPNITVGLNAPFTLNLAEKITDADAELAVRLATTKGDIDVMLFPSIAPNAVTNYLSYVLSGDYNGMAFHRLISGFVLQGGSLRAVATPRSFSSISQRVISPINEPGVSNLPGTLCAAKVGARNSFFTPAGGSEVARDDAFGYVGDPNSATTDFFINLADNAANLDNQNGGFTAFGRVTTVGMSVVNTIAALPTGSYTGDKSLLVDGSLVPFSAVPMNDAVAPADMDANKTVRVLSATLIPTQTYSFSSTAANIASVEVENFNLLKITGLAAGTRTVTLTARDLDGKTINQDFTITVTPGHLAPAITKQPLPATVTTGAKATFSVTATGTSLTYQWRRGGADLPGKTTATLVIDNVQAGNTGLYDVLVSNATTTLTSTPALLSIRTRTDITGTLPSRLLDVGTALELEATVTGFPTPTFTWKRGTTAIKGQTTQKLSIPAVKLTDAGLYSATATNTAGSDTTTISKVCIVDKAVQTVVAAPNKLVKITAPLAGPFESYRWRFNGVDIPLNTAGMSGFTTPTLTITSVRFDIDSGDYTCRAVAPDGLGASVSGIVRLAVSNAPILSLLTLTDSPPLGIVGNGYQYAIPYLNVAANMPTSFVISGLPPGLSYLTTTGIIFGRPTKAGTFTISAQAKNPAGTGNKVTGTITVLAMRAGTVGTFTGLINPSPSLNASKGGRLDLTVTDTSAFSASLLMGKDTYKAAGQMILAGTNQLNPNLLVYHGTITFNRKTPLPALTLDVEITESTGEMIGAVADGTNSTSIIGYRQFWNSTWRPCFYTSTSNLGLSPAQADVGKATVPQGTGFMTMKITSNGIGTFAGKLADDTTITASSVVGPSGQTGIFQMLYNGTGSLLTKTQFKIARQLNGSTGINRISGPARWIKDAQPTAELSYQLGIPETNLDVLGYFYSPPVPYDSTHPETSAIVLKLPNNISNNAQLDFSEGGLGAANPDLVLTLTKEQTVLYPAANPAKVALKIVPATGSFSGTFDLLDGTLTRRSTFQGLIIPDVAEIPAIAAVEATATQAAQAAQERVAPSNAAGLGYFILSQLPTPPTTTISKTPKRSGKVVLQPLPLSISPQPVAQTVNPGTNVTFTIGATGGIDQPSAMITYEWRKNGVPLSNGGNITGTTSTLLTITAVTEANDGIYDCIVRRGVSATTSDSAALNVNDPVGTVAISRLPADAAVMPGSSVTFTATHTGTGPFTYQWRKGATDITAATAATYTQSSVVVDDAGDYNVLVKNIVSTAGVSSAAANNLKISVPVSNVVITRTPSSVYVATSQTVTFSVTAQGSTPLSYVWLKDGIPIPGVTTSQFIIPNASPEDIANYTVSVTNDLPLIGVISNSLGLNVTDGVTNIVIAKSYTAAAVAPNTNVSFTVTADGNGLSYQWRKNGATLPGETAATINITAGTTPGTDSYDVLVSNLAVPDGVAGSAIALIVALPVTSVVATRNPSTTTVVGLSGPIVFTATNDGSGPYTYNWRRNGTPIPGANSATYTIQFPVDVESDGDYDCIVGNQLHNEGQGVTSNLVPLNVVP